MTSLESIVKNFYFEEINKPGSRCPKFGKAGRKDFLFTCKRCGSQSEPMHFNHYLKYRLGLHLVSNCHPSTTSNSNTPTEEEEQEQKSNK